jgi:hypothetical protein
MNLWSAARLSQLMLEEESNIAVSLDSWIYYGANFSSSDYPHSGDGQQAQLEKKDALPPKLSLFPLIL